MLIFTGGNSGAMFTLNETTGVLRTTRQAVSAVEIYDIVKYQFLTRAFKFITEAAGYKVQNMLTSTFVLDRIGRIARSSSCT